jgi:hypothetical protein
MAQLEEALVDVVLPEGALARDALVDNVLDDDVLANEP